MIHSSKTSRRPTTDWRGIRSEYLCNDHSNGGDGSRGRQCTKAASQLM
jgi:hypothetical protein